MAKLHKDRNWSDLLSGPAAIFTNPPDGSRYGESAISIKWHSANFKLWESVNLYCDGNGDEAEGFLKPMVRFASWDRKRASSEGNSVQSSMIVELATLPFDSPELERAVVRLQMEVDQPLISKYGLITRRNFPDFPIMSEGHLHVSMLAVYQDVSRSAWVSEAPRLHRVVNEVKEVLRNLAQPVERKCWLESYEWSPDEWDERQGWKWDGSPG